MISLQIDPRGLMLGNRNICCFNAQTDSVCKNLHRGLYRVHQFSKVEMFVLCRPEESESYHEELIKIEEDLFSALGLHYKWVLLPTF
jgi:hypothetical protein